ncbi:MAG: hypothetical protein JSR82_22870 [Verrucomicrobia bacterium]|nr:hypothetical protein [Verrucomicrobiota bacterium]
MKIKFIASFVAVAAAAATAAHGQTFTTIGGFEGTSPLANIPATPLTNPAVTLRNLGDVGGISNGTFGLAGTQGSQFGLLSTFSNGGGTYPPGSPFFPGPGATAGAGTLWNFMFTGGTVPANQLTGLGAVAGSVITFDVTMQAGDQIRFDWRFFTSEPASGGNADGAFVGVRQGTSSTLLSFNTLATPSSGLVSTPLSVGAFDFMSSAWGQFSFTAATTGSYRFAWGVFDAAVEGTQSALGIDNISYAAVPEPTTYLAAAAALGLVGLRLRRKSAPAPAAK